MRGDREGRPPPPRPGRTWRYGGEQIRAQAAARRVPSGGLQYVGRGVQRVNTATVLVQRGHHQRAGEPGDRDGTVDVQLAIGRAYLQRRAVVGQPGMPTATTLLPTSRCSFGTRSRPAWRAAARSPFRVAHVNRLVPMPCWDVSQGVPRSPRSGGVSSVEAAAPRRGDAASAHGGRGRAPGAFVGSGTAATGRRRVPLAAGPVSSREGHHWMVQSWLVWLSGVHWPSAAPAVVELPGTSRACRLSTLRMTYPLLVGSKYQSWLLPPL